MNMKPFVTGMLLLIGNASFAQQKWNLRTVVEYAMANNIVVKQSEVQARVSELTYKQSKLSQFPDASFSTGGSVNSGSNQDPTSFNRITQTYFATNMQLQTSADIFNFFSKRNTIEANKWELEASKANIDKLKNDIALTAANGYLQVLLAKEQENVTSVQLGQTQAQLLNTRKLVDAGALPELNASQLEAQLALDSVNYITAKGNVSQSILLLKSYMNIDAAAPFEVDIPPVEAIPVEPIADLQPEYVYKLAMENQPLQKVNDFRIKAAEKNKEAAKGFMYPSLAGFGSLGSGFNNQARTITGFTQVISPVSVPIGTVNVSGTPYTVFTQPVISSATRSKTGFSNQLSDNFRQSIGLNINVPIFNGGSLRTNYERSKLNITTLQYQKTLDDQNLKQDIYQAYNAALVALEKFNAGRKTVEINEKTFNYASKRFDVGMLSTFDLITTQNNLLRARLEYTISRFDYVFKMKVLEFYKGQGLKL
ncbi:MAG: TolC family protein [Ferruginibacter sp.]